MGHGASGTALEATAGILLVTALTDALGFHSASFLFVILSVPVAAVALLGAIARVIDRGSGRPQVWLSACLLAVVLFGAAVRSPAIAEPAVPPAAPVALAAAFLVLLLQALVALGERSARTQPAEDVGGDRQLLSFDSQLADLVHGRIPDPVERSGAD